MARKPRRNKSSRHDPKRPTPAPLSAYRLEQIFGRQERAILMQKLMVRHNGDVPVRDLWQIRAMHYQEMLSS